MRHSTLHRPNAMRHSATPWLTVRNALQAMARPHRITLPTVASPSERHPSIAGAGLSMAAHGLSADDEALLDRLEHAALGYFLQHTNPDNGLVADTSRPHSPCSIAVVGFALSCYPIAVERGWMTRADALERTLGTLRFFANADHSGAAEATGYKGFYFHFLDMHSGARAWQSELSVIDTALLIAGVLSAATYFDAECSGEVALRSLARSLYDRVDWRWAQHDGTTLNHGWKPECGFLAYCWGGYSEAIVLYALALGSATHPIDSDCYRAWTATYQWENLYGHEFLYAGPLFVHQFSHAWIDLRGIRDRFMRGKRCDYFENSRRATEVQREYARRNPLERSGYDEDCWGLTACDGPNADQPELAGVTQRLFGYSARGVPYGPDDGSLGGWAAVASLPFAPAVAMRAVRDMLQRYPEMLRDDRYASSFNPGLPVNNGEAWVSQGHYGLDQGIVVMMIENLRSGLPWRLMRTCPGIALGLRRAGFRGGWLA
ncbi:MAG: glucoamylase family protein [Xanthomonadaceae bacterium]|nr:glucoamylase family protein [Xanthomonadaceae bacterium]MDZ4377064.1 glucoamylase family protein [Xanthomonadaceae bacterium]